MIDNLPAHIARRSNSAGPRFAVNLRRLDGGDLLSAPALPDDVQPARQRCIAERAVCLAWKGGPDGGRERFPSIQLGPPAL